MQPAPAVPLEIDPAFAPQIFRDASWTLAPQIFQDPSATLAPARHAPGFYLWGKITRLNGEPVPGLVRLDAGGNRDPDFHYDGPALVADDLVIPLADGRLLVGQSSSFRGLFQDQTFFRLNADGSTDSTFPGFEISSGKVTFVLPTIEGKTIVAGHFYTFAGVRRDSIARLNPDGTVDPAFAPMLAGSDTDVTSIVAHADGSLTLVYRQSQFGRLGGLNVPLTPPVYARIKADGTIDSTFAPSGAPKKILAAMADGKVILAGNPISRLNADGSVDTTFSPQVPPGFRVEKVVPLTDGRLVVGATIPLGNPDATHPRTFVLQADGALEAAFSDLLGVDRYAMPLFATGPGTVAIRHHAIVPPAESWALASATDPVFALVHLDTSSVVALPLEPSSGGEVRNVIFTPDGKLVVSGTFDEVDGQERPGLARLMPDGTLDATFVPPDAPSYLLDHLAPDGRLYVHPQGSGFSFDTPPVWRLLADGSRDATLPEDSDLATSGAQVRWVDETGTIYAVRTEDIELPGDRSLSNLTTVAVLERYSPSGELLSSMTGDFRPQGRSLIWNQIFAVRETADGGLLVTAATLVSRLPVVGLYRLNPDLTLDADFSPEIPAFARILFVDLLEDGRAVVPLQHAADNAFEIIRLLPDGRRDPTFHFEPIEVPMGTPGPFTLPLEDGSLVGIDAQTGKLLRWFADGSRDLSVDLALDGLVRKASAGQDGSLTLLYASRPSAAEPVSQRKLLRLVPVERPGFVVEPTPKAVVAGRRVVLEAAVGDFGPVTYQWQINGQNILGARAPQLVLDDVSPSQSGNYRVIVATNNGAYVSEPATLTVSANTATLANFSVRGQVQAGGASAIAGFVTDAAPGVSRPVLFRAIGRGFPGSDLSRQLAAPRLTLSENGADLATDAGSARSPALLAVANRVGAFEPQPWSNDSGELTNLDSAVEALLHGGIYTVQATSADTGSGLCLLEYYDAGDGAAPGFVVNMSLRSWVGPDDETMIGGFVVSGDGPLRLLVRAIGADLGDMGVSNPIADPHLTLFAASEPIAENDDWADRNDGIATAAIESAAEAAGAFPLPSDSRSAVILGSFEPGAYTVHLASSDGSSGEGLLEIYVVP